MLLSRTTCSRCASHIRTASAHNVGRTHRQVAHFSSTLNFQEPHRPEATDNLNKPGSGQTNLTPRSSSARKASKTPWQSSPSEDAAVALFNDVVKPRLNTKTKSKPRSMSPPRTEPHAQPVSQPTTSLEPSLGEWEIAGKLKELADQQVGSKQKLQRFQTEIWPYLQHVRGHIPRHLYLSATHFLTGAIDAAANEGNTSDNVNLSQMYAAIGKLDLDLRNTLVLNLCHQLTEKKNTSGERTVILNELLGLWQHISQLKRKGREGKNNHFALPSADDLLKSINKSHDRGDQRTASVSDATSIINTIFLQFRPEQVRELIPGLLATIAVLSDPRLAKRQTQMKMAPLLNLAAVALGQNQADTSYVEGIFAERIRFSAPKLTSLHSYVVAQWPQATAMLSDADASWRRGLTGTTRSESAASSALSDLHKQLRTAYRSRNPAAIVSIWQDFKANLAKQPSMTPQLRDEPDFLDFWIFVWCAVRRPNRLQETLELMKELQVQPTVRSYTAMMHGWKMCKDADKIEALWDKLVEAGLRLDVVIWTERISGLIEAGKPQAGVQALGEMMATWKAALNKSGSPTSAAVQPSIEVVNAAFKGLVRLDLNAANEVLSWAGREGIEPNIRTYNILLRESFRNDTADDIQGLLKAMKKQGIDPDAATFTIILEEVLGAMDNASGAEQVVAVEQVFADIAAAGLRPNLETYGKMLYAVASLKNGADEAMDAVQAHMRGNGFSATPHMVTILIERALGRDPPDMAAIQALLQEHHLNSVSQGDQTLWERVMSAYAVTGNTERAMTVFNDLSQAGRPVTSLPCLTDLLKALIIEGNATDAHSVVDTVLRHKMKAREEDRNRYWRHHFWYLAKEQGLLDWDKVPQEVRRRLNA